MAITIYNKISFDVTKITEDPLILYQILNELDKEPLIHSARNIRRTT